MATKEYTSSNIMVLQGLDAVRLRPGMYIGTTGSKGMHHLLWEIVDNAMDEVSNKFGNHVIVTMHADNSITVEDDGRGIPVDKHPTLKVSGVEVVFTQLHAGGKFNNDTYSYSGGLHGVGASVTNALSDWLKVTVYHDGTEYFMQFHAVEKSKNKVSGGVPVAPLAPVGKTKKRGTKITFMPDKRIFGDMRFDFTTIAKRLKELAFLNKGVKITLIDENVVEQDGYKTNVYHFENGVKDFIAYLNEGKSLLFKEPIYIEGKSDLVDLVAAIQYTNDYNEVVYSFVNNIPTGEGGTHETGFKSAITRAFNDSARAIGLLKEKDANLLGEDYREGIIGVLSIKMKNVQFEGQTKTKLGNPEAKTEVDSIVYDALMKFCQAKSSKSVISAIIEKAKGAARVRESAKKAKEVARQKNSLAGESLSGKYSPCTGRNPQLNEIFIVEGDSAGGSAKQARDRSFQAVLPLRGKPLNVEKKRINQILENQEIRMIIAALGTGIEADFNINNLKFDKVVIMADADQDGAHIRSILLTFFYRYMRELIAEGHVYVAIAPLYKVYKKNKEVYVYDETDYEKAIKEVGEGYQVQRYKGLGEMDPEQLWSTTMDPERRVLLQVSLENIAEAERLVTTLMGDNVEARKQYIIEYANFNKKDIFEQRGGK